MARKPKQQQQAGQVKPTAESVQAASSLRPQQPATPSRKTQSILRSASTSRAVCLVILAALYSPLSQRILSPVYGSIPSATYHKYGLIGSSLLAFALRGVLPPWVDRGLPAFAFWVPTVHMVAFQFSAQLGNPRGPLVVELLTCFPLVTWSLYLAGKVFEEVDLSFLGSESLEEAAPSMVFYMLFNVIQRIFRDSLPRLTGFGVLSSRVGLQLVVGTIYGLILPKSLFWPAIPSIVITMTANVHNPLQRTTAVLNNTLALHDYTLLDRFESVSGYLSVLEDNKKRFRVMRCDHSLLGGQWLDTPKNVDRKVEEPIYAVFTMMEAVRLVEPSTPEPKSTSPKKALNIGLGIGTAPSAMIAHGINTTIVELDPVIHYLAGTYFNLPTTHRYFIGDAEDFVFHHVEHPSPDAQWDYILHDVFTGGAVPTSLFTYEFLTALSQLLKPTGTIAINYAGDLHLPSAFMVHRTITAVFPNCRVFREDAQPSPPPTQDFTNLVYFCTHPTNKSPIKFRRPVSTDYLGSDARRQFLLPKYEVDPKTQFRGDGGVVSKQSPSRKEFEKWEAKSALGHWALMRTVVPDVVWENW